MNWVAAQASAQRSRTGSVKNILQVAQKPGAGAAAAGSACGTAGAAGATSRPPFLGSRTNIQMITAVITPITPTQMNA